MGKRFLTYLLTAALVFTSTDFTALAAEGGFGGRQEEAEAQGETEDNIGSDTDNNGSEVGESSQTNSGSAKEENGNEGEARETADGGENSGENVGEKNGSDVNAEAEKAGEDSSTEVEEPYEAEGNTDGEELPQENEDEEEVTVNAESYLAADEEEEKIPFSGKGEGTESNPYVITNVGQMQEINNDLSAHYVLDKDLDLSGIDSWVPIGDENNEFEGSFDGKNHTIKNLTITDETIRYAGLFGNSGEDAVIKNLNLTNVNIQLDKASTDFTSKSAITYITVGAIAAIGYNLENCMVSGSISAINCLSAEIGGIVGYGSEIADCTNKAEIYCLSNRDDFRYSNAGSVYAGGIVGHIRYTTGSVKNCCNYGEINIISGDFAFCGGISGENGAIKDCVNYKNITGKTYGCNSIGGSYYNCNVGGIVGYTSAGASDCINYGNIDSYAELYSGGSGAGGIVGYSSGNAEIINNVNICSKVQSAKKESNGSEIIDGRCGRIVSLFGNLQDNYSIDTTLVNGAIPTENIGSDQKNGTSLSRREIIALLGGDIVDIENSDFALSGSYANIYVLDSELGIPIAGAMVNGAEADSNGYVPVEVVDGGEEKLLVVSADDYSAFASSKFLEPDGTYYISLEPAPGELKVIIAQAEVDGKKTNLLTDKMYLEYTVDEINASEGSTLEIEVQARGVIEEYAIIQDGNVVAKNTDGKFSFPVIVRDGQNTLTRLKPKKDVSVRVKNEDGDEAYRKLGIFVAPSEALDIEEEDKSGSVGIGSGISVTLPDDIPFLGGGKVSYGFENPLPFELTVENNGEVKLAINKSDSQSMAAFKEDYDKLSERAKSLSEAASAFGGSPQSFGGGYFSAKVTVKGYGEGYIDMDTPGTYEVKVGLIVSGNADTEYMQYFFAGPVPVYITVGAGAEIKGTAELAVKYSDSELSTEGGVGTLSGKIYLTAKAGIGIDGWVSLSVSGTGACNYSWKPKDYYTKVWLSAGLELNGKIAAWDYDIWKSPEATYVIYESDTNEVDGQSLYSAMTAQLYDSGAYTLMDRSYAENSGGRSRSVRALSGESGNTLQSYVYPGADPKLVNAGGTMYLFWLQDIAERSSENRAAVVYAVSTDGKRWSSPRQLVAEEENQTLDNALDVYVDGSDIYVCWQDAAEVFESGTGLNDAMQKQHISYAVIDAGIGNVTICKTVTQQAGCYMLPHIYAKEGQVRIAWVQNTVSGQGGLWDAENSESLCVYDSADGVVSTFSLGNEKIVSMDGAVGDSQTGVLYLLDTDGDFKTTDDREICFDTRIGTKGSRITLTGEKGMYENPVAEDGVCYWYADGNICYASVGSAAVQQIYGESLAAVGSNFKLLSDSGNTEIVWNAIDYETGQAALYGISSLGDGQWTKPYKLEQTDSDMTGAVSGCIKDGRPYFAYMHIRNEEDGSKCHSIRVTEKKDVADICLEDVGYDYEDFAPGITLPITAKLTNKGTVAVSSVELQMDGETLGNAEVDLGVGETKDFTCNQYTVPDGLDSYEEHTLTVLAAEEDSTEDNSRTLGLGFTDMTLLCSQRLLDGETWLDISVLNKSAISSDVTLNIRRDRKDGEILYTEELGRIEGGKGVSLTVSLGDYEDDCCTYVIEVATAVEDVIEGNNTEFIYIGYGTEVKAGDLVGEPKICVVNFDSQGGSDVESVEVEEGYSVPEPENPIKAGCHFKGWYLDGGLYDFYEPVTQDITLYAQWEEYETLVEPSASIASGSEVETGAKVALTCAASGVDIYYTLDGTDPTRESTLYTEPIAINEAVTIKAFAVKEGYKDSDIATFTYTVTDAEDDELKLSPPKANYETGSAVAKGTKLTLTSGEGASIYYSIDGTEPTRESILYTEPIAINEAVTIKAFAVKEGYKDSDIATFTYTVTDAGDDELKLSPPKANYETGSAVAKGTKLTLTSGEDASIYYTIDGTEPTRDSILYTEPLTINSDVTIKAFSVKDGYKNSDVVTFIYTILKNGSDDDSSDVLPEDIPAGGIPNGLWIAGIDEEGYPYTGETIKPEVRVYDGSTLLKEKTDYTVSYKNNKSVGKATVTVTSKGNYSGKETVTFDILPVDMGSEEVYAMEFYVKTGGKVQKPVPELYYMGTKLKNNKDFTVSYSNASNIYAQVGEYGVTVTGKGNYTGTRDLKLMAVEKIVKPKPVSIAKAALNGFNKSFTYTGNACRQECTLTVKTSEGEKTLAEGMDYTVRYANNVKAGTATVTYYGRNGYTGKLKKTYKILPYDILNDQDTKIKYENNFECVYAKGGSKPNPIVTFDGKAMKEGVDYTLSYKNNKAVAGNKTPCVVVNGKGCFKGKISINFTIKAQDLSKMTLVSGDRLYKNKANIYKITPKLMDLDGKLLSSGKDFDQKSITYVYAKDVELENGVSKKAGSGVEKTDIIPAGTQIRITLNCGSGSNYTGTFTGTYRIAKADIKSAKVTIPNQLYTGGEITLDKSQITVKLSGVTLKPGDYDIIQYADNVKKGKASVTIKGKGDYGGVKTVKFTIGAKGFLWWWRK